MKALLETIATILFFSFCLALMFLLKGDPSLWDVWHKAAIGMCK